jgi:hypothetical protein
MFHMKQMDMVERDAEISMFHVKQIREFDDG